MSRSTHRVEAGNRAMQLLRQAIAHGFRDLERLAKGTDLDPLRMRPDFQLLMLDLAFPADPFGLDPALVLPAAK